MCLCVTGGCCGSMRKRTIVGGYAFTWWFVTDVQRLSLEVMTLNPVCESVETAQGVPLTVTGVAQCKIMKADELLHTASEQFLGKSVHEIKSTILSTLEGHLRAILGTPVEFSSWNDQRVARSSSRRKCARKGSDFETPQYLFMSFFLL